MRNMRLTAIVIGTLLTVPAMGLASNASAASSEKSTKVSTQRTWIHMAKGVVRSVDASSMMIARSPYGRETTFVLNPETERDGTVQVGSTVFVRYESEAGQRIATVVTVEHAKEPPSTSGAHQ